MTTTTQTTVKYGVQCDSCGGTIWADTESEARAEAKHREWKTTVIQDWTEESCVRRDLCFECYSVYEQTQAKKIEV